MSTSASAYAPPRVTPNLGNAFGGIFRLTLRRFMLPMHWITLVGLLLLLALMSLPVSRTDAVAKQSFMGFAVGFYLTFLVPIMAFITAAGAIRDEMKAGNVDYVFTRPIPRPAFIGFKFLSYLACAQLDFLIALAAVVGIGMYRHVPNINEALPALLGSQLLIVTAFSAFGFFCGVISTRYIVIGLAYGAIVELGVGQIPTQISKLSMTHQVHMMLKRFLVPGEVAFVSVPTLGDTTVGTTIVLLLGFTAIMLFLAASIFSFLELSGPNES